MRFSALLFATALPLAAQQAPIGMVRGHLLEWEAGPPGEISIRTHENRVYRLFYDEKTYFERDHENVLPSRLSKDDTLEILCDRLPGKTLSYARTVQVLQPPPPRRRVPTTYYRPRPAQLDFILPRGDLTFAGVILRVNQDRMVLRTRQDGIKKILLRSDTRFLSDGKEVALESLRLNTRVFIRAGTNLDNDLEAYQVVWGSILEPGH